MSQCRAAAHPAAVARLVSGVVVAVCLLIQAVVRYGQFGEAARAAQATRDRLGNSALVVAGRPGSPPSGSPRSSAGAAPGSRRWRWWATEARAEQGVRHQPFPRRRASATASRRTAVFRLPVQGPHQSGASGSRARAVG
ncbi:hypothetical protein [Kitasatospora sp. NPDC051914]|uniref:hypothetical protein n=1 Tax=Kitasatospora sp. NPDC051914 TaxID=3154945 RepID=UPI0034239888